VKKTSKFSKRINYDVIEGLLSGGTGGLAMDQSGWHYDPNAKNGKEESVAPSDLGVGGDGEEILEETIIVEEGGGVGVRPVLQKKKKPRSRSASKGPSEAGRTDEDGAEGEEDGDEEGEGHEDEDTLIGMGMHTMPEYEYEYDETYEQEV
jgi:hypothetical protein